MADQAPNQSANIQQSIPPTLNAGHYLVGATVGEISFMFGHTRLRPIIQDGQLRANPLIEWFTTITLSPTVARQLYEALGATLDGYIEQFGAIPGSGTGRRAPK